MARATLHRIDKHFDKRVRKIQKRHRKLAHGYVQKIGPDGLIVVKPRRRMRFPWKGIALVLMALFAFKGFLHAQLGGEIYDQRVAKLQNGTVIEKAGAWAMQADPLTIWISGQVRPYLR